MREKFRKTGNFYKGIIISNIGIFIFIGILSVIFQDYGWFPCEDIYALSQFVYRSVLPLFICFEAGRRTGGTQGGITAVLAVSGVILSGTDAGLILAMLIGPAVGAVWKFSFGWIERRNKSESLEMLIRNLWMGILGSVLAIVLYYTVVPCITYFMEALEGCSDWLVSGGMTGILGLIAEPVKVVFLNNILNHGILIPLGMSQMASESQSVLFLIETNPGPGLGMLAAMFLCRKEKRDEYGMAMFTQAVGGLHEVYFPYVLTDLRLLLPLTAGGFAGTLVFELLGAGLRGVVSPGSIVTILLMAGRESWLFVLAGIVVSASVSFAGTMLIEKRLRQRRPAAKEEETKRKPEPDEEKDAGENAERSIEEGTGENVKKSIEEGTGGNAEKSIEKGTGENTEKSMKKDMGKDTGKWQGIQRVRRIAVVCDGGMGTSAMGAAVLRRKLAAAGRKDIEVNAYAADLLPEGTELIVCQKDFYEHAGADFRDAYKTGTNAYTVDSLMEMAGYDRLIQSLSGERME